MKISAQTKESSHEANDLKSFRKFLKKRKIKTILLSIAATVICFVAVFTFMNKHVTYISYKDAGITIVEDNKDEVTYRTNIKGNYRWRTSLDVCSSDLETVRNLKRYAELIPEPYREVFHLRIYGELSFEQIGRASCRDRVSSTV